MPDPFESRIATVWSAMLLLAVMLCAGTELLAQSPQTVSMTLRLKDPANTTATSSAGKFSAAYARADVIVLKVEATSGPVQQLRHIEYSADQIVVVALAADGSEKSRVVMIDPRLVRLESFIEDDRWTSSVIYHRSVDFSVALPDNPAIVTINVLKPRWTGSEWLFDVLAETVIK